MEVGYIITGCDRTKADPGENDGYTEGTYHVTGA